MENETYPLPFPPNQRLTTPYPISLTSSTTASKGEGGTYDKDLDKVQQNRLDALALPSHIRQCSPRSVPTRRRSTEEVRSKDNSEVRAAHLIQRFSRSHTARRTEGQWMTRGRERETDRSR